MLRKQHQLSTSERTLEAAGIRFEVRQRYDAIEGRLQQEATLVPGEEREEGRVSYGVHTAAGLRRLFLDAGWSVVGVHGALDGRAFALAPGCDGFPEQE